MIKDLEHFRNLVTSKEYKHIFILSSPIIVFIAKLVINNFSIPQNNVILINSRNTCIDLIGFKSIYLKSSILDRFIKKFFLFSYQGFKLRKKIEKISNKFILYCDWDNREVIEILNSKKLVGQVYIEEGQLSFNNFPLYSPKKDRLSQLKRLKRWRKNLKTMKSNDDIPLFNECFNKEAFAFFTISNKAFPQVNNDKKFNFSDFSILRDNYKPKLLGQKNIGIMCSPRRLKFNNWEESITLLINILPENTSIKLHPEYYSNLNFYKKFINIFNELNYKKHTICEKSIIVEAEMLFEKKILYGPMTSLKTYAPIFGSKFIDISIY